MSPRGRKTRGKTGYMISAVAEMYNIHPQTLRLYEREGLLVPSRTNGNTRLYGDEDLERLEAILNLARDLGVNLAGIEIILNMRDRMQKMQVEMQAFVEYVQKEFLDRTEQNREGAQNAMVRINPLQMIRSRGGGK
jgi:MerR family transcriptional regulator/heat shock protein HspR